MKKVIRYQTDDGRLHITQAEAIDHADKRYGLVLSKLAQKLLTFDKYSPMMEYIDQGDFAELAAELAILKQDIILEEEDDFQW